MATTKLSDFYACLLRSPGSMQRFLNDPQSFVDNDWCGAAGLDEETRAAVVAGNDVDITSVLNGELNLGKGPGDAELDRLTTR